MITQVDKEVTLRPAKFACPDCGRESQGQLLSRTRKSLAFGLPLCKETQCSLKCDVCGSRWPTLLTDSVYDPSSPIPIYAPPTSKRSAFPPLLLALFSVTWCVPIIGLVIYWSLFDYGAQIRGGWLRAYALFVWLTLVFHLCWGGVMAYLFATGKL